MGILTVTSQKIMKLRLRRGTNAESSLGMATQTPGAGFTTMDGRQ